MNRNQIVLSGLVLTLVAGCAEMAPKKVAEYIPEVKKEISYTFESSNVKESKEGLNLVISKSELMDETYKVNECGAQANLPEQQPTPAAKPAMAATPVGGLFGGLGAIAAAASGASTLTAKVADKPVAPVGSAQTYKVIEKRYLPDNAIVFKVELKSEINHVLGFEKSHFLLKDPNGNLLRSKPIVADSNWSYVNWCATKEQASAYFDRMNVIRDLQSAMVLPKDSYSAYVAFYPQTKDIAGDWKLLMYELPVSTNTAGVPSVTDHFYSKGTVKKWETTFKKATPTGSFEKVETKEVL